MSTIFDVEIPSQIHPDCPEWIGMFVQSRNLAESETQVSRPPMPEVLSPTTTKPKKE